MKTGTVKRIICIGNRYVSRDSAGYKVFRFLSGRTLPEGVELIDGGLAGLDLLPLLEGVEQVVFVDSIHGFGENGDLRLLGMDDLAEVADGTYDHSSGLPYLVRLLPRVGKKPHPKIRMIGIEGIPDEKSVEKASLLALKVVKNEFNGEEHPDEQTTR